MTPGPMHLAYLIRQQQGTADGGGVPQVVQHAEEGKATKCWADGPRGECRREATTLLGLCYLHERQIKR